MSESNLRFLVIRLSSIGDIVHTLPAVAALGEAFPEAEIHWAVEKRYAPLLAGNPYVDRVMKLDTIGWRTDLLSPSTLERIFSCGMTLRESIFDATIDFQGLMKSACIARLSRSHVRVGFAEYWLREPLAGVFYTDHVAPRAQRHIIEMNLALVESLGVPHVPVESWKFPLPQFEADNRYVENLLQTLGAREFIIINPGGGWKGKCWAPENYAELIHRLEPGFAWKFLLTGSPDEETLIREILRGAGSSRADYFPSSICQFIALARRAKLFIGGDTGPAHLAAAVGTPVVQIFNGSDRMNTPERNGPFSAFDVAVVHHNGDSHLSRDKHSDYLRDVSVETVYEAVHERLARVHE
jgi:lipopolysaccharide heptosyltransferase I